MMNAVTYNLCKMGKASLYCWMHLHTSERLASVNSLLSNIAFATAVSFCKVILFCSVPASTWSGFRREGSRKDADFGSRNDVALIKSTFLWENLVSISTIAIKDVEHYPFKSLIRSSLVIRITTMPYCGQDSTTDKLWIRLLLGGLVGLLPHWEKYSQNESHHISFRCAELHRGSLHGGWRTRCLFFNEPLMHFLCLIKTGIITIVLV